MGSAPGGRAGMGARRSRRAVCAAAVTVAAITALVPSRAGASATPFISGLTTISEIASTVPANGDINPYGVAVVHHSHGKLRSGSVLVSNFNASSNQQGTGSTIVEITPAACGRSSPPRRRPPARRLPRRCRADHGARGAQQRLGDRGQPSHLGWHSGHGPRRMSDHPQRPGQPRRDHRRPRHQRPVGYDGGRER